MKRSLGVCLASIAFHDGAGCTQSGADPGKQQTFVETEPTTVEDTSLPPIGKTTTVLAGISPEAVAVFADLGYAATIDGVVVFRVAQGKLEKVFRFETLGQAHDVAIVGKTLYIAEGFSGLSTWSLDHPEKPTFVSRAPLHGDCRRVVASERGAAALCLGGVLTLVRPGKPTSHLSLPGEPRDAVWIGEHLYVASSGDGLLRIDVDEPDLRIVYRDRALYQILSLTSVGDRLFVGLRDKRVLAFSVASNAPELLGETTVINRPTRLLASGNVLLVASNWAGDTGATWLDISTRDAPRPLHRSSFSVAAGANFAATQWLVAQGAGGLSLLDATNQFEVQGHVDGVRFDRVAGGSSRVIAWAEGSTYAWTSSRSSENTKLTFSTRPIADAISCGDAFCVADQAGKVCRERFDSSEKPICIDVPAGANSLAWQDSTNTLWMLDGNGGLHGFLTDPNLRAVFSLPRIASVAEQNFSRFVVQGNRGVAVDPSFAILQIIDLGPSPRWRGHYLLHSRPSALALSGENVFVAEPRSGLQVIDLKNPDRPHEVAFLPFSSGPLGVAAGPLPGHPGHDVVALALGERGLWAGVWQDNAKLVPFARSETPGFAADIAVFPDGLWVANGAAVLNVDAAEGNQ